jgi:hypothetical protein
MLAWVGVYFRYVWFPWSTKFHLVDLIAGYIQYTSWTRIVYSKQVQRFNNLPGSSFTLLCMWLHAAASWDVRSARMVPVQYGTPPCRFDCWLHNIHKVNTDSSPAASAPVQQLGGVQLNTIMYVATCWHELWCTFGMYGSRAVWNSNLSIWFNKWLTT